MRVNFLSLAFLISTVFLFPIATYAETLDKVIVIVNSEPITQNELTQQMGVAKDQMTSAKMAIPSDAVLRKKVLDKLIDMKLQVQLAKKLNIVVTDHDVDKAIATIAAKNHITVDQLKSAIEQHNMTYDGYRKQIKDEILLSQVTQSQVIPTIKLTDAEVDQQKERLIKKGAKGDVDKQARLILLQKKFPDAMKTWLEQLRSQAYVKTVNN